MRPYDVECPCISMENSIGRVGPSTSYCGLLRQNCTSIPVSRVDILSQENTGSILEIRTLCIEM